jgi:hypothetical protein
MNNIDDLLENSEQFLFAAFGHTRESELKHLAPK